MPCSEDDIVTNITSAEYLGHFQASQNQGKKDSRSPPVKRSRVAQTVRGFSSRSRGGSSSARKAGTMDQQRRARIDERLEALQELLPSPKEGGQASVLDDIIDHIKYLQFRIKDLSQNRLAGEPSSYPFVFLEGYGHYTTQDNMLNEPLEELIGKLLEVNPLSVSELLQTRGLAIMPNCF
ncbi:transcription factor LRL2-like [Impatiens glandulifera]|uniref:transcription factor LRL2-like n=1 Tax=Impatiens glandulifera TaxID=253017 RepID=UPI001FB084C9|nr:transcription factor LRL2-like [Impatiens glandulifera]